MGDDRIVISSGTGLTPEAVSGRSFGTAFRGYDQGEVRAFLKRVAEELASSTSREAELRRSLQEALNRAAHPELDEQTLTSALGEHAARLLANAREAATNIVSEAETRAARIIGEAEGKIARVRAEADGLLARRSEEAERLTAGLRQAAEADARSWRERARAEAEAEVESARAQGREMVSEARALRERMLADLTRRRRTAEVQLEQLRLARQRLLEAYGVVRRTLDEATAELSAAEAGSRPVLPATGPARPGEGGSTSASPTRAPEVPARPSAPGSGPAAARPETPSPGLGPPPPLPPAEGPVPEPKVRELARAGRGRAVPANGTLAAVPVPEEAAVPAPKRASEATAEPLRPEADATAPPDEATATQAPAEVDQPEPPAEAATVEDLFARLRAASGEPEPPTAAPARPTSRDDVAGASPPPAPGPGAAPASAANGSGPGARPDGAAAVARDEVADESARARRDELLEPVEADLVRSLKRALQDEQNEVLDNLRRQRRPSATAVLPDAAVQGERYRAVVGPVLQRAAYAGAEFAAGTEDYGLVADAPADELVEGLIADLLAPLRQRLERVIEEGTEAEDALTVGDGVSAAYRQWKTEQVERIAQHAAVAAFAAGALAATPVGTPLRWVVDDDSPCPDCDDNALAGALPRGEAFPTGQIHPPAHVGCRCLLVTSGS